MIAVIGGTGITGSQVVKALKARGADFKCIVRDPVAAAAKLGSDVNLVQGDLADRASLEAALEGVDRVFMVCGHSPALEELETNALEAMKTAGVSYVVYTSGSEKGIRPDSPSDILIAHYKMEEKFKAGPWKWAFSRPNYYTSNLLMMADPIKNMGKMISPVPPEAVVTMIHPADIGECDAELIMNDEHAGQAYYLAGPAVTFSGIAEALTRVLGKEISYMNVPPEAARKAMEEKGMPDWLMQHLAGIGGILAQGGMGHGSDWVEKLTGHAPRTLDQWIEENRAAIE